MTQVHFRIETREERPESGNVPSLVLIGDEGEDGGGGKGEEEEMEREEVGKGRSNEGRGKGEAARR